MSATTIEDLAVQLAEHRVVDGVEAPIVGRYQLVKDLGAGSFGRVFRARDHLFGRDVALKLTAARDDERDMREPRSLAVVEHDNVVKVYDVGVEGSFRWMAMELVDGVNLRQWMKGRRRTPEVLAILHQAGEGLAAIHAKGIAHRDIKPENIMVSRSGRVKLIDLGLAKEEGAIGTLRWAAPEVAEREPDHLSDQYSFALVCKWALEIAGASMLANNRFIARAIRREPGERWRSLADGLRFLPHYHRWKWQAIALAVLIGLLAGAGMMHWLDGGGSSGSIVPKWVAPLAATTQALELAEAGLHRESHQVFERAWPALAAFDEGLAARSAERIADTMRRTAEGPEAEALSATTATAAADMFARAGDDGGADRCREKAAAVFKGLGLSDEQVGALVGE